MMAVGADWRSCRSCALASTDGVGRVLAAELQLKLWGWARVVAAAASKREVFMVVGSISKWQRCERLERTITAVETVVAMAWGAEIFLYSAVFQSALPQVPKIGTP